MVKQVILTIMILLSCTGCAINHKEIDNNPPFSAHHFRDHDVEIRWQAEPSNGSIRISGTVCNVRPFYLRDVELTARLLNEDGKVIARETHTDFPDYLPSGKLVSFDMEFHLSPGTEAEQVQISYFYWLAEGASVSKRTKDVAHIGTFSSPI